MSRCGMSSVPKSRPGAPRLLSTIDGAIENIFFSFPSWIHERARYGPSERRFIDCYLGIVKAIMRTATGRMRFTILTHASATDLLAQWLVRNGLRDKARLIDCPDDLRFTVWADDMFLVGEDQAGRHGYGIVPPQFPRSGDGKVAEVLARSGCFSLRGSPLFFQGGNILVGDDFLLIGADDLCWSLRQGWIACRDGETENAAVRRALRLRLDRGRTAHVVTARAPVHHQTTRAMRDRGEKWTERLYFGNVAGTRQPLFHIDMFISLVGRTDDGRFKLLVGDPRMAATMVGNAGWPDAMVGPSTTSRCSFRNAVLRWSAIRCRSLTPTIIASGNASGISRLPIMRSCNAIRRSSGCPVTAMAHGEDSPGPMQQTGPSGSATNTRCGCCPIAIPSPCGTVERIASPSAWRAQHRGRDAVYQGPAVCNGGAAQTV